jgi:hypothetical protein
LDAFAKRVPHLRTPGAQYIIKKGSPPYQIKPRWLGVARYWLEHFDHYQILFSLPPNKPPIKDRDGIPFGRSPVVVRTYSLHDGIVRELFETHHHPTVPTKHAVDTLVAAVHGIVAFPKHTRTMDRTDRLVMAEHAINAPLHFRRTNERRQK